MVSEVNMHKSPLLQAVKRHTRIAALSRPLAASNTSAWAKSQTFPTGDALPMPPVQVKARWLPSPTPVFSSDAASPNLVAEQYHFENSQSQPRQPVEAVQPQASKPIVEMTGKTTTSSSDAPATEDKLWNRLQAIFNRHQEKEQQENSQVAEISTQDENISKTESPAMQINAEETGEHPKRSQAIPQQSPQSSEHVQRKVDITPPTQSNARQIPPAQAADHPVDGLEAQLSEATHQTTIKPSQAESIPGQKVSSPAESPLTNQFETETSMPASNQAEQPVAAESPQIEELSRPTPVAFSEGVPTEAKEAIESDIVKQPQADSAVRKDENQVLSTWLDQVEHDTEPQDTVLEVHANPLQDVWPVQENQPGTEPDLSEQQLFSTKTNPTLMSSSSRPPQPQKATVNSIENQDFDHIQRRLEKVSASPSNSSIEYIPPRRPRPLPLPTQTDLSAAQVQPPIDEPRSEKIADFPGQAEPPFIQTKEVMSDQLDNRQGEADQQPRPSLPGPPPDLVQRKSSEDPREEMYPTEIGALPADLWQLIGEKPPLPSQIPPTQGHPGRRAQPAFPTTVASPVMRAVADRSPDPQSQTTIEKQTQIEENDSSSQMVQEAASEKEDGQSNAQEMDIQELAKKVYNEIKNRLAIEWERTRF
jgi:hypothetical protein